MLQLGLLGLLRLFDFPCVVFGGLLRCDGCQVGLMVAVLPLFHPGDVTNVFLDEILLLVRGGLCDGDRGVGLHCGGRRASCGV